jgi:N-acetylglucosaminyl-diphospho-decaprenol L-rhamnosyltransferase
MTRFASGRSSSSDSNPSDDKVEIGVVVVTHNSQDVLAGCLEALPGALAGIRSSDVIVVDNASADDTTELVERCFPSVGLLVLEHNAGYAAAINAGLEALRRPDRILVLNPDVRLAKGCVSALARALGRPGVGIAVPRLVHEGGELWYSQGRRPTITRAVFEALAGGVRASKWRRFGEVIGDRSQYDHEKAVDWATGAVMLISDDCAERVGPWDESFFLYSEETDYCLRAGELGFLTWYTPSATSIHLGGESTRSPYLWSLVRVNRVRAYRKHHGVIASTIFWLVAVVGEALRAGGGSPTHRSALRALLRPGLPLPMA